MFERGGRSVFADLVSFIVTYWFWYWLWLFDVCVARDISRQKADEALFLHHRRPVCERPLAGTTLSGESQSWRHIQASAEELQRSYSITSYSLIDIHCNFLPWKLKFNFWRPGKITWTVISTRTVSATNLKLVCMNSAAFESQLTWISKSTHLNCNNLKYTEYWVVFIFTTKMQQHYNIIILPLLFGFA